MSDDYSKLPDYLRPMLSNPDLTIASDGVYTRTWTSERIADEQPPEAIRAKVVEWNINATMRPIGCDMQFDVLPGGLTFTFKLTSAGSAFFKFLSVNHKPRRSRKAARRRLSKRRKKQ